jgi:tetratricopeptide (TPR) repeat protein
VLGLLLASGAAAQPAATWNTVAGEARVALMNADYASAREKLALAEKLAEEASDKQGVIEVLRRLAALERLQSRLPEAAEVLTRALGVAGYSEAPAIASLLSEMALVRRAMGEREQAVLALLSAIQIRQRRAENRHELAADLTALGGLRIEMGEPEMAKKELLDALAVWESIVPADAPQLLPVLDALGAVYRDTSAYAEGERVYRRALLIRETVFGPKDAELISTLDSLAYVLFGQGKFEEAEPFYKRLLSVWETSAGPEHPMVALTLDKMAEFYSAQKRYDEAAPLLARSLELRTKTLIDSLNRNGRVHISQNDLASAEELYRRAIRISDESKLPDDVADPLLRTLARILRQQKNMKEANALEARVKAALARRAEKEGLRPSPVKPAPPGVKPVRPAP